MPTRRRPWKRQEAIDAGLRPITDVEFVALCRPGTNPDVALRVRRIVADVLGVDYDRIHPSARLIEDLGAD